MKMVYKLIEVTDEHPVIESRDYGFWDLMQRAALLGLKEAVQLNEIQCRQAEEILLAQFRKHVRSVCNGESGND